MLAKFYPSTMFALDQSQSHLQSLSNVISWFCTHLFRPHRGLTLGLMIVLYTFRANMELADNMDESVEDMTAALTAPRPKKVTHYSWR